MITLQAFDATDWMGFAGAEPFENGDDPLVSYQLKVDELEAVVLLDSRGLVIQVLTPDGEEVALFSNGDARAMRWLAVGIPDETTTGALVRAGFDWEPTAH